MAAAGALALSSCFISIGDDGGSVGGVTITQQPQDISVTVGSQARFSVGVAATGSLRYQWRRDGTAISGATSFTYTTPPVVAADNGALFSVRVCNEFVCVNSDSARLTVIGT